MTALTADAVPRRLFHAAKRMLRLLWLSLHNVGDDPGIGELLEIDNFTVLQLPHVSTAAKLLLGPAVLASTKRLLKVPALRKPAGGSVPGPPWGSAHLLQHFSGADGAAVGRSAPFGPGAELRQICHQAGIYLKPLRLVGSRTISKIFPHIDAPSCFPVDGDGLSIYKCEARRAKTNGKTEAERSGRQGFGPSIWYHRVIESTAGDGAVEYIPAKASGPAQSVHRGSGRSTMGISHRGAATAASMPDSRANATALENFDRCGPRKTPWPSSGRPPAQR